MPNQKKSKAFTLLELIISIIVISIIMTTIPLFLQTLISSSKVTSKEEVFFSQFSLLSLINTKYFDENNTKDENFYKDLNTSTNADASLRIKDYTTDLNRIGKHQINNNIFRSGSRDTVSIIGYSVDGEANNSLLWDDIDDFDGYEENINFGVKSGGYSMKVEVNYLSDTPSNSGGYNDENITFNMKNATNLGKTGKTNIKLIKITTEFSDGSKVVLEYPTCNIGASKLLSFEEITR